jgi:hypothetical protein
MMGRKIRNDYVLAHSEEFPRENNLPQPESSNNDGIEFQGYALNALKNLKT